MQGIQAWARANPARAELAQRQSELRLLPRAAGGKEGPPGALACR